MFITTSRIILQAKKKIIIQIIANTMKYNYVPALILAAMLAFGCNNQNKNNTNGNKVQNETSVNSVMTVDNILENADALTGKEVEFEGICTHTCSHSGRRMFVMGSDDTKIIRVESGNLGGFDKGCSKNVVKVKGILNEQRIDEAYLKNWEKKAAESTAKAEEHCSSEKKAMGETANSTTERIRDFRKRIEERNAKEGKNYLSFYYVTAVSYEICHKH